MEQKLLAESTIEDELQFFFSQGQNTEKGNVLKEVKTGMCGDVNSSW